LSTKLDFPKSVRLLNAGDYSQVFNNVDFRVSSKHFLVLAKKNHLPEPRLGIIVAKKHVKLAVQRNRLKRLLRESFRLKRSEISNLDLVILAKKSAGLLTNEHCAEEYQYLWKKLNRKLENQT